MDDMISRQAVLSCLEMYSDDDSIDIDEVISSVGHIPIVHVSVKDADCISRAEAIRIASGYCHPSNVAKELAKLPSAQPERKKGRFIGTEFDGYADGNPVYYEWKCSECGCVYEDEEPTYNFCPNCGAEMRGEQDG